MNEYGLHADSPLNAAHRLFSRITDMPAPPHDSTGPMAAVAAGQDTLIARPPSDQRTLAWLAPVLASKSPALVVLPDQSLPHMSRYLRTSRKWGILNGADSTYDPAGAADMVRSGSFSILVVTIRQLAENPWREVVRLMELRWMVLAHWNESTVLPEELVDVQRDAHLVVTCDSPDTLLRDELCERLGCDGMREFVSGWVPEKVEFRVEQGQDPRKLLAESLGRLEHAVLIYTDLDRSSLAGYLNREGFTAEVLEPESAESFDRWRAGEIRALLVSNAEVFRKRGPRLGGIVHYGCPVSLARYQEQVRVPGPVGDTCRAIVILHPDERRRFEQSLNRRLPIDDHLRLALELLADLPQPVTPELFRTTIGDRLAPLAAGVVVDFLHSQGAFNSGAGGHSALRDRVAADRRRTLDRFDLMEDYCVSSTCRRQYLASAFGEPPQPICGRCDNCRASEQQWALRKYDARQLRAILRCIAEVREKFGRNTVIAVLRGLTTDSVRRYGLQRTESFGVLSDCRKTDLNAVMQCCLSDGLVDVRRGVYPTLELTPAGRALLGGESIRELRLPKQTSAIADGWDPVLYEALRTVRTTLARQHHLPTFVIARDGLLQRLADAQPRTPEELHAVKGMGEETMRRFGDRFLAAIREWKNRQDAVLGKGSGDVGNID